MKLKEERQIVKIPAGLNALEGELIIPAHAKGIVLFAHGSGSSRFSPRNQFVARKLQEHSLATLLIDLLTAEEDKIDQITRELRFDIDMLADRLLSITEWLMAYPATAHLPISYFGSSTGAAAALIAAAKMGANISAVVSRGGRCDMAAYSLPQVQASTLFIVGGDDSVVLELNAQAFDLLSCVKEMKIIPHAGHLFEEPGALEKVSELASQWFLQHSVNKNDI